MVPIILSFTAGHENYDWNYDYFYGFKQGQVLEGNYEFENFSTINRLTSLKLIREELKAIFQAVSITIIKANTLLVVISDGMATQDFLLMFVGKISGV